IASLQSDNARSGSFLVHHHPQRLPNAMARLGALALGSLMTRSHAAMLSSALLTSPASLQRSRSLWLSARAGLVKTSDVTSPARSTEKRIFPPVFPSRRTVRTPPLRTSRGGCRATFLKQSIREVPPTNHDYQPLTPRKILNASWWMRCSQRLIFSFHCGRSAKSIAL